MKAMASSPGREREALDMLSTYAESRSDERLRISAIEAMQSIPDMYWSDDHQKWKIQNVEIATIRDRMIYDVKRFDVEAGRPVRIRLTNRDSMPHNLLVCKPGSMRRVGGAADNMGTGPDAAALNYVPEMDEIMHILAMIEPGEIREMLFVAPSRPGRYPYVCTFPGHWPMMNGVMTVRRVP